MADVHKKCAHTICNQNKILDLVNGWREELNLPFLDDHDFLSVS